MTQKTLSWQMPLPLSTHITEQSSYPIDALPSIIRNPILNYHQYGQQPIPLIACSALANISLACQTLANVARDHLLVSPVSLYFLIAAQSGERKSAADKAFGSSVRDWQKKIRTHLIPDVEQAALIHYAWRSERDLLVKQLRQTKDPATLILLQMQLDDIMNEEPEVPLLPELFFEDVTQEGLVHSLSKGWPSSSLWSDEGGIILAGSGMQANATKFIATLNRLWDGNPFITHRKTTKSFEVDHRRFSMSMMVQPLLLKQLLKRKDGIARHSGFLARSLMTQPLTSMGSRYYQQPPESLIELTAFHQRIQECLDQTLNLDRHGCQNIPTLQLSPKAKAKWVEFFDRIESGMNKPRHWQTIQDFASKSAENVARLSALFHLFTGKTGEISVESIEQATDIVFWHLLETKRMLNNTDQTQHTDAERMLQWIKEKQITEASSRYFQQYAGFRDKTKREQAIEMLIEHHYLAEAKKDGKAVLLVNPKIH